MLFYVLCYLTSLSTSLFFSEQCIEAYELLLALAESEQSLVFGQFKAAGVGTVGKYDMIHVHWLVVPHKIVSL